MPLFRDTSQAYAYEPYTYFLKPAQTDPTTDDKGEPLVKGAWYYNTINNQLRVFNGTTWLDINGVQGSSLSLSGNASIAGDLDVVGDTTFGGSVELAGDPAAANEAANKNYVDTVASGKVSKTGGDTITGNFNFSMNSGEKVSLKRTSDSLLFGELFNLGSYLAVRSPSGIALQGALGTAFTVLPNGAVIFTELSSDPDAGENTGVLYYNGPSKTFRVHDGTAWSNLQKGFWEQEFSATEGQSVFNLTAGSYELGTKSIQVFLDGFRLVRGFDYLETSPTSITLTTPASSGDLLSVVGYA